MIVSTLTTNGRHYGRSAGYERHSDCHWTRNVQHHGNNRASASRTKYADRRTSYKDSLLAIERKTDILATIINSLLQESTLIGRLLFCIYIDKLLLQLSKSGLGCFIGQVFLGALAYADDVVLLAPTHSNAEYVGCLWQFCSWISCCF